MAELLPRLSPEWWLVTLAKALDERQRRLDYWRDYYEGRHPLPTPNPGSSQTANAAARRAWERMAEMGLTNFVALVADAPAERLSIAGFRFGQPDEDDAWEADDDAWELWQDSQLDADIGLAIETALQQGSSYLIVWPREEEDGGGAEATVEDPSQVIVAYQAGTRRRRVAALKRWLDDDGFICATVYLPDGVWKYRSRRPSSSGMLQAATSPLIIAGRGTTAVAPEDVASSSTLMHAERFADAWLARTSDDEAWPLPNPFESGRIPVLELRANARLRHARFGGGVAEFDKVLSIQDRINKTVFDRLVTAEHQAFRQRYVLGWDYPQRRNPQTGTMEPDPDAMLRAAASKLWTFDAAQGDVRVGELGQADFSPFLSAAEGDVRWMASITKTPAHYLLAKMENVSSDTITASEAGLINKCKRHARAFGEVLEELMSLLLEANGEKEKALDTSTQIIWGDHELRTWGETVDAVVKMASVGVPEEELWAMLPGSSPQTVRRWRTMKNRAGLRQAAAAPPPPPGAPPAGELELDDAEV